MGHPVLSAGASSHPSDLLDLGSIPGHQEARAFALLARRRTQGLQRGPPTSEPKWSPDIRPEDAARCLAYSSLEILHPE